VLNDVGSTNGTKVNGRSTRRHVLSDGDMVSMGHSDIEFRHGALLLPPSARVGGAGQQSSGSAGGGNGSVGLIIGGVLLLLVLLVVGVVLLSYSNKNTSSGTATATSSLPAKVDTESIAHQWVSAHRTTISDEIAQDSRKRVRLEYPALLERVRKQVDNSDNWRYKDLGKVTENIYRVSAVVSFSVGMVNPPDYWITAKYILTVNTETETVDAVNLEKVTVVKK